MSEFKNKSITTKGLELLSKGLSGDKLEFTRIEMGGGDFTGDIGEAEELVDVKQNLPITKISRKGSQVTLSTALKIEDITVDFDWTEIGVYAKGNDGVEILYLYGHTHNSSFVSKDSLNEKLINITLMVSNVAEVTAIIDDSLVYLTAEALQQHEEDIHTHTDIREALKEVKDSLSTLDISWEGIKGKPQQFPPTQHNHSWGEIPDRPTSLLASGGNADTVGGRSFIWQGQGGQPWWVWGANEPGNQCYVWNPSTFNVNSANYVQGRNLCSEVDGLKQSVVNGKQLVVNAINGKLGYNSGLTTDHSHNDYAWWITNQIPSINTDQLGERFWNLLVGLYRRSDSNSVASAHWTGCDNVALSLNLLTLTGLTAKVITLAKGQSANVNAYFFQLKCYRYDWPSVGNASRHFEASNDSYLTYKSNSIHTTCTITARSDTTIHYVDAEVIQKFLYG